MASPQAAGRGATTPRDAFHPLAFQQLDPKRACRRTSRGRLFTYEPLMLPRHIRVLKINNIDLLASKNWPTTGPPRLPYYQMVQLPLDSLPEYTALSYTWGHPKRTHVLKISGASFPITASLAEALRALPRIAPSEYLWIDQVCINQADDKEKNHQVEIMGEIYSNSHKVIIWTGGETKGLQLAVDTYSTLTRQLSEGISDVKAFDNAVPVDASPLHRLLMRPWFRRAWVIQEAVLAKTAVVVAGPYQLTIEDLYWASSWPGAFMRQRGAEKTMAYYASKVVLDTIMTLKHPTMTERATFITGDHGFDSLIMDSLASSHASDPRDHVYAFLGFQNDPNISIVPDYGLSVLDTFTRAASAVIRGTNSLELFRFLPNQGFISQLPDEDRGGLLSWFPGEDRTGLPSWVPDWSGWRADDRILRSNSTDFHRHSSTFDAAKGTPHRPIHPVLGEERKLVVSGCIVDSIASMMTSVRGLEREDDLPRFFGLTDEEVTALDETALSDPTQRLRKRLVVMFTGGCIGVEPPGVEEVLKRYDEEPSRPAYDRHDPLQFLFSRDSHLSSYTPVRSQKNKLGRVREEARVGDLVVILHGFQVPIVLRPTEEGTYVVVGQCYLEDAMFGEAMTWKEDEADQFTLV